MRFPNTHETNPTTPLIFVGVLTFHYLCPHPINIKLFLSNLEKIEKRIETTMDQRAQVPPSDRYFTLTGGHYLGAWWALLPTSYNLKIFIERA